MDLPCHWEVVCRRWMVEIDCVMCFCWTVLWRCGQRASRTPHGADAGGKPWHLFEAKRTLSLFLQSDWLVALRQLVHPLGRTLAPLEAGEVEHQ